MDAPHHLGRKIVEGGDIELEHRKGDTDGIGEMAPDIGTKTFRKAVLEIIELDLDRSCLALGLLHIALPLSLPGISLGLSAMAGLVPTIHVLMCRPKGVD